MGRTLNYLAHLFLSGNIPLLRIGNLAGDFVKGIDTATLHPAMQKGIALHRAIDAYTDSHEIVWRSKSRIGSPHTRLAGVLVDVFYDHFLAVHWNTYCDRLLEEYVAEVYADLQVYRVLLPPLLQDTVPRIIEENWLVSYRNVEGLARALDRIEQRLEGKLDLSNGIREMERNYAELDGDFRLFFPELSAHVQESMGRLGHTER